MRATLGAIFGIVVCLSGPLLGYAALNVTQWEAAYAAVCMLTNFLGGAILVRYTNNGAYICAGFVALAQSLFSIGLVGASVWSRLFDSVVIFSLLWVPTVFAGIFVYLCRVRRPLTCA